MNAGGGGDKPEAVKEGMSWAMSHNDYRPYSRKAMLIFGDAPPHQRNLKSCLELATTFNRHGQARVHTISCRRSTPIPEFYMIASAGGGRAFGLWNRRGLMEELLVMAFGPEHRLDVLEYFELGKQPMP